MHNHLKILLISDLHTIVDNNNSQDSRLEFIGENSEYADGFIKYVKSLDYQFDLLICAGDISNKANLKSFEYGWNFINRVGIELNIGKILSVPGNHDHASRSNQKTFGPKHHMQHVTPSFPSNDFALTTHFWAWNWCHVEHDNSNIILLNSSAYHGYEDEHKHGRIPQETALQIEQYIKKDQFKEKGINFLICHHHPYKMDHITDGDDYESMDGGDRLGNILTESSKGPWIIIHGHKHIPQIRYAPSTSMASPIVFSAGSFSAKLYPELLEKTKNQFYVIDIDLKKTQQTGRATGKFETYEWSISSGWRASESPFLPAKGGFGSSKPPYELAMEVVEHLNKINENYLNELDLSPFYEHLNYFTPWDIKKFQEALGKNNLEATFQNFRIVEIGKKNV